jgi:hypothetical protein
MLSNSSLMVIKKNSHRDQRRAGRRPSVCGSDLFHYFQDITPQSRKIPNRAFDKVLNICRR